MPREAGRRTAPRRDLLDQHRRRPLYGASAARRAGGEGFVVAADLGVAIWSLSAGANIAFDVAIDVSLTAASTTGPQGHRVGQYFLHVGTAPVDAAPIGTPFADPRSFCSPTLAPM